MKGNLWKWLIIAATIALCILLIFESHCRQEECRKLGGIWLSRDSICVKGERIELNK